jgi:2-polyprenyl-6-methoxyphenol hydroxylase-like FAD-dependent oxidoreductase
MECGMANETISVACCIAGGGPAGMMAGVLLARAGVPVVVLEKHGDFLRDFRGDTIHPSTLELMHELGWAEQLLTLPHQKAEQLSVQTGDLSVPVIDFRHLPVHYRFIALMPQWDFLTFLAEQGRRYPGFALRMQAEVTGLIEEGGRVVGVEATTPDGKLRVRAPLVLGADGRHSVVRGLAGLAVDQLGAPMDVLWFSLSRRPTDPDEAALRLAPGVIFVMLNRGEHWQCGYVIAKGSLDRLRAAGLESFRAAIARLAPFAADRIGEIEQWDSVKLLTVAVDRLRRWHRPGLLCIGDAAHAMSPVGGLGINLAIQDAVAAANLLSSPLRDGTLAEADLARVARRRALPTRLAQRLQILVQNRIIAQVLRGGGGRGGGGSPPLILRLLARFPLLRRLPARLVGLGFRPEHVRTRGMT